MVEKFNSNGFVVLENVIEKEVFNKIKTLAPFYIERTLHRHENSGNILYNLFRTDNLMYDFPIPEILNNETIYKLVKEILGFNFRLDQILIFFSEPNNHIQNLHSDQQKLFSENIILPTSNISSTLDNNASLYLGCQVLVLITFFASLDNSVVQWL